MPIMKQVDEKSPLILAYEQYKLTEHYANTLKWAKEENHVEGSLWAAFAEGWRVGYRDGRPGK